MKVLLCGHRSFAAKGLLAALAQAGHEVVAFSRGAVAASDNVVTGPVDLMHENPHLDQPFDTVINYIVLKDETVEPNVQFMESLLEFCRRRSIKHLIHISSISSYKASVKNVTEDAEDETEPLKKGPYGALKVAQDQAIAKGAPAGMKVTLVRPGFVLGSGLVNPIVGTAARLPWNKLLVIGNAHSHIPVTTRELVNEAVVKLTSVPPATDREVVMLASPESPTRYEFLQACCRLMGMGLGVVKAPVPAWWVLAVGSEVAARMLGQGKMKPYSKLTARLPGQNFDPRKSMQRLGIDLRCDWQSVLQQSLDGQEKNYDLPYSPRELADRSSNRDITFLGFGRIVKQKHLPALKRLKFAGDVRAYDVRASNGDYTVQAIEGATIRQSDLFVVASPGPVHIKAIEPLRPAAGPVLVEKPLCYSENELRQWTDFAASRPQPIYACHNYRYKKNVARMLSLMEQHNAGRLRHIAVHFQSPPVSNDSAAWLRDERRARTLLMDYSLHFLDLACMFGRGGWKVEHVRHTINSLNQTDVIEGSLTANYSVSFLLTQGFQPRRARVMYSFQNYIVSLGFFPDTFAVYMADDNPWLYKQEARESRRATLGKIADKILNRDSDDSHARVIGSTMSSDASAGSLQVQQVAPFYRALFEIGQRVYSQ
ncbi:MAG TPA: NAD-dependent epimerase/dehydratase family protein [Tepidisphaeraceae bacterium]|jgi:nucleoside-diphosphate-sugar epimerase